MNQKSKMNLLRIIGYVCLGLSLTGFIGSYVMTFQDTYTSATWSGTTGDAALIQKITGTGNENLSGEYRIQLPSQTYLPISNAREWILFNTVFLALGFASLISREFKLDRQNSTNQSIRDND